MGKSHKDIIQIGKILYMYPNVQSSTVYNNQDMEAT